MATKLELREFNGVKWYNAGNDVNGNSRVLVEYTEFLTPQEVDTLTTAQAKETAAKRAKNAFFHVWRGKSFCGFIAQTMAVSNGSKSDIARVILAARNK